MMLLRALGKVLATDKNTSIFSMLDTNEIQVYTYLLYHADGEVISWASFIGAKDCVRLKRSISKVVGTNCIQEKYHTLSCSHEDLPSTSYLT